MTPTSVRLQIENLYQKKEDEYHMGTERASIIEKAVIVDFGGDRDVLLSDLRWPASS